ncbi:MAG: dTDP-4-dehydrorhamnose reductase [Candidatus Omnitrophica bacterium]|nr:dTDP-4-dehydrorhamnose reductase [Candidatus Omnitrophota bacterium]
MVEKAKRKKRRKILVTGSSGMLGTALCERFRKEYRVIGLDNVIPDNRVCGAVLPESFVECDITSKAKTVKSVIKAKPDLIIHTAAWTDVDGCERDPGRARLVNAQGTANVACAADRLNVALIYISTDFVFDGRKKKPYRETDSPNPLNVYGRFKLEGEQKVAKLKNYIILRTGWLFGEKGKNFVDSILDAANGSGELRVVDDQFGCPTFTKDFAAATEKLLDIVMRFVPFIGMQDIYHITNKGEVSWFSYAKRILKLAKMDAKAVPIKSSESARIARRPSFSVLDNRKFERVTGFVMRPWEKAVKDYLNEKRLHKIIKK